MSEAIPAGEPPDPSRPATAPDPHAPDLALGVTGVLAQFNRMGILAAADVHVALRLAELAGERDEAVKLAVALAVRAPRHGHVYVDLERISQTVAVEAEAPADVEALPWPAPQVWAQRLAGSSLVATGEPGTADEAHAGAAKPLRLVGPWLYLDRLWAEERQVAKALAHRAAQPAASGSPPRDPPLLARLFDLEDPVRQRQAVACTALRRLTVIGGGPGTGKTTTIARAVALLYERALAADQRLPLVALAAPTGKAAARLGEAIRLEATRLNVSPPVRMALQELQTSTIHRLLGRRPDSRSRFRHDGRRRLPHDVVVVDECSMVSLSLMARLLEAIRPQARLVLVGDPDQLTSIEAGAVFGDIVGPAAGRMLMSPAGRDRLALASDTEVEAALAPGADPGFGDGVVMLERSLRFGGAIATLAAAVRQGDPEAVMAALRRPAAELTWIPVDPAEPDAAAALAPVRELALSAGRAVHAAAAAGSADAALAALDEFRLLCAHRQGPAGASTWNDRVAAWLGVQTGELWYCGRPLLITENDYELGLFNGDTGVVLCGESLPPTAAFPRSGTVLRLSPARLPPVQTLYAMTIHKSQGSQFDVTAVLLPRPEARLLTRELLYTAITRARQRLIVVGSEAAVRAAVMRPVARASGLRRRLWGESA